MVHTVSTADPLAITAADLRVRRVGEPAILSPRAGLVQGRVSSPHSVHESDRVLLDDTLDGAEARRPLTRPSSDSYPGSTPRTSGPGIVMLWSRPLCAV